MTIWRHGEVKHVPMLNLLCNLSLRDFYVIVNGSYMKNPKAYYDRKDANCVYVDGVDLDFWGYGSWRVHFLKHQTIYDSEPWRWSWTVEGTSSSRNIIADIIHHVKEDSEIIHRVRKALSRAQEKYNMRFSYTFNHSAGAFISRKVMEESEFKGVVAINYNAHLPRMSSRILNLCSFDDPLTNFCKGFAVNHIVRYAFGHTLDGLKAARKHPWHVVIPYLPCQPNPNNTRRSYLLTKLQEKQSLENTWALKKIDDARVEKIKQEVYSGKKDTKENLQLYLAKIARTRKQIEEEIKGIEKDIRAAQEKFSRVNNLANEYTVNGFIHRRQRYIGFYENLEESWIIYSGVNLRRCTSTKSLCEEVYELRKIAQKRFERFRNYAKEPLIGEVWRSRWQEKCEKFDSFDDINSFIEEGIDMASEFENEFKRLKEFQSQNKYDDPNYQESWVNCLSIKECIQGAISEYNSDKSREKVWTEAIQDVKKFREIFHAKSIEASRRLIIEKNNACLQLLNSNDPQAVSAVTELSRLEEQMLNLLKEYSGEFNPEEKEKAEELRKSIQECRDQRASRMKAPDPSPKSNGSPQIMARL